MDRRQFLTTALAAPAILPALRGAAAAELTKITFSLDFRPLGRHAAWYVAAAKGYYREAGLDVTIIGSGGTAQSIQNLESGAVQIAFSDVAGLTTAHDHHVSKAKMYAVIYQKAPYAVFSLAKGADVTKVGQLQHLTIGSGAGSFTQTVIRAYMRAHGLDPATVSYTNIDPSARIAMLASGRVPAVESFAMSFPGLVKAVGPAQARMFLFGDHGLRLYSNGIIAEPNYVAAHPAVLRGFIRASLRGWRDTIANPKEAATIVSHAVNGIDPGVALQEIHIVNDLVDTPYTKIHGLGAIDPTLMTDSINLILGKRQAGKVTAAEISDASYLPAPPILP